MASTPRKIIWRSSMPDDSKPIGLESEERCEAMGPSAGGHLVALLGTTGGVQELEGTGGNLDQSSRVQRVVDRMNSAAAAAGGWQCKKSLPGSTLLDRKMLPEATIIAKGGNATFRCYPGAGEYDDLVCRAKPLGSQEQR